MRVYIKTDMYGGILVQSKYANEALKMLDGAIVVREDGWGQEKKYVPATDGDITVVIVPEDSISLPDAPDQKTWVKSYQESQMKLNEAQMTIYKLNQQIKELTTKNKDA
jgi:hypothetical protein